jgi:HEAT repeat protein
VFPCVLASNLDRQRLLQSGYGHGMGKDSQVGADALKDVDDLALVGSALALGLDVENDDGDQDEYRRMTHELCRRGTQLIFDEMARLTLGEDLQARILACNILGELGFKKGRPFGAETFPLLARLCTEEASPPVLGAAISAMGNLGRPEALPYVVAHATHSDPDVRFSVACALPSVAEGEWLDQAHLLVTTLMQLTSDEDSDVRDWATFGLGTQVKVDGAAVRQRLIARLDDPDEDTRAEQRLVDARQFLEAAELFDAPDVVATCAIHAAIAAADAITCHALGERSRDGNHVSAVDLLRQVDSKLSTSLKRALDRKNSGWLRERRRLCS